MTNTTQNPITSTTSPTEGFSNFTEALVNERNGGPTIDYKSLSGRVVRCLNKDVGAVAGVLQYRTSDKYDDPYYWTPVGSVFSRALHHGWNDMDGWVAWIEGEVPIKLPTADTLPLGTGFRGEVNGVEKDPCMVIRYPSDRTRVEVFDRSAPFNMYDPGDVSVLEVYGLGILGRD